MMKKSIYLRMAALCAGALALACVQEPLPAASDLADPAEEQISITAVLEDTGTRTSLQSDLGVCWSAGDQIRVFSASKPNGEVFTLSAGAGTGNGVFSGSANMGSGPYYAVYPASAGVSLSGASLRINVPATQTYAEGSFGAGANLAVSKSTALDNFAFRNVCGVLSVTLTGSASIDQLRVSTVAGEPLNGTAVVGWTEDVPTLAFDSGQTADANRQVLLTMASAVSLTAAGKTFYVVLPAGTLSQGFFVDAGDAGGKAMVRHSSADAKNAIVRSEVRPMPAVAYAPKYKESFVFNDGAGAFSNVDAASSQAQGTLCAYTEGSSQYAWLNTATQRNIWLRDWAAGYSVKFTMPYAIAVGQNVSVSISKLGTSSVSEVSNRSMKVVKQFGERVWLYDSQAKNGYILFKVNEED